MKYSLFSLSESRNVVDLFRRVFTASEGKAEGQIIAEFVSSLIATTKPQDLIGCMVEEDESVVGSIFFSRFHVPSGDIAFILSPVAVSTDLQRTGIGKKLIGFGLEYLRSQNVSLAFTYGDPAYYSKTGFRQIPESLVQAPCALSQPMAWLAQSLDGKPIQAMDGPTQCVDALNDPNLW